MRVSLEDQAKKESSAKASPAQSSGGKMAMTQQQKIKAIVAVAVIVLAAVWILYSQGVFDARSGATGGAYIDPTPEQLEQNAREIQQAEEEQTGGNARVAPRPLGSQ